MQTRHGSVDKVPYLKDTKEEDRPRCGREWRSPCRTVVRGVRNYGVSTV